MLSVLDWVDSQIYLEEQKRWVDIEFSLSLLSVEPNAVKSRGRWDLLKFLEKREKVISELHGNIISVKNIKTKNVFLKSMHHTVRQFASCIGAVGACWFKESDIVVSANDNCTSNLCNMCKWVKN